MNGTNNIDLCDNLPIPCSIPVTLKHPVVIPPSDPPSGHPTQWSPHPVVPYINHVFKMGQFTSIYTSYGWIDRSRGLGCMFVCKHIMCMI